MKPLFTALAVAAFVLFALTGPTAVSAHNTGKPHFHGEQLSQNPGHLCYRNCIEQNGSDAKASCAMQCGIAGNAGQGQGMGMGGQGQKDCGTLFKQCRKACGSDKACQNQCREARKQCY
ncbi:MAG: hypothetical protein COW30_01685 [Rhodospirillales bacterium CG15_BIG_FIL_POST_REV_8_21_14_020_66_15]|nr:MAG: hypothetical protein COW30_01685 [Rhodospirillales bacterium CG15_BIG_FIL_POST_REV_8_21_14_020_66_15]